MQTAERRTRPERPAGPRRSATRRRGYDEQPTDHAEVLVVSLADGFSRLALDQAVPLAAGGGSVAVLAIARVYGSSLGFPNPGLMPTRREMQACTDGLDGALAFFKARRIAATGQIAVTRREIRQVVAVARARGVAHVILSQPDRPRWRQVVEGNPARSVARRLGADVQVHAVAG